MIWPYQRHFRACVELAAQSAFHIAGLEVKTTVVLVGISDGDEADDQAISIECRGEAVHPRDGELHRWLQVNGHDDRCEHMQPTDGGIQYGSETEFG